MLDALLTVFGGASGITGLLGGLGGAVLRLFAARQARQARQDEMSHELAMLQEQAKVDERKAILSQQAAKALNDQQLAVLAAQAAGVREQTDAQNWAQALSDQMRPSGNPKIDALNASVRPVLTYWWCLVLYTAAKILLIVALFAAPSLPTATQVAEVLFTKFDEAVVASLFGFWFVDRALRRGTT